MIKTKTIDKAMEKKIKTNLNITNGEKVFQTYKEISDFIVEQDRLKNTRIDKISSNVFSCCMGKRKHAYGYKWSFVNEK